MGAYAPAPCLTPKQVNEIKDDILTVCPRQSPHSLEVH